MKDLIASHDALARRVRELDPESLQQQVAGQEHTVLAMLNGVVEHGTYHGGQVALLKRALG